MFLSIYYERVLNIDLFSKRTKIVKENASIVINGKVLDSSTVVDHNILLPVACNVTNINILIEVI